MKKTFAKAASAALLSLVAVTNSALAAPVPRQPPAPDTPLSMYGPAIQSAVSAYFNTFGLKAEQVKPGLVIPWVVDKPTRYHTEPLWGDTEEKTDKGAVGNVNGYVTATGEVSDKGCPMFKVFGTDIRNASYRSGPPGKINFPEKIIVCPSRQ